jgi:lycopene beta-cyclase
MGMAAPYGIRAPEQSALPFGRQAIGRWVMSAPTAITCDIAIIGGGLAGGLAALALAQRRPDLNVQLVESGSIGGNHVWSWFDSDIAEPHHYVLAPLSRHHWTGYDVRFPDYHRTLETGYNSTSGMALSAAVRATIPESRIVAGEAAALSATRVTLSDQHQIGARHVIDARGAGDLSVIACGWQKFLGQRLTIAGGHGIARPIVMDATVEQLGGYRFIYCLPFDAETLFVEDTYYADTPQLDLPVLRQRIADYAAAQGWQVAAMTGEETGVLPVVKGGDFGQFWPAGDDVARIGVRAGAFQATTGYSLPDAVRFAAVVADHADAPDLPQRLRAAAAAAWRRQRFYRMLDTMMFDAADPGERYRILQRFYTLAPGLVERFYAGQSTSADKLRILSGKPPVPLGRAIRAIGGFGWL